LALFLVALLAATMPLRLALFWAQADRWLSAADVEGSIWGGVLKEGHVGHLSLGDARMALDVPALLSGRIGLRFFAAGDLQGSGIAMLGRDRRELRAQSLRFPIQALSASLPLDGDMMLSDVEVAFRDGTCRAAQGSVVVKQVRLARGSIPLASDLELRGALGCAGNDVIARLVGRSGSIAIRSTIRIGADGAYRMENRILGLGDTGDALAAEAGFAPEADGYARFDRGNLAL
jgi:general secretion pathway protein N